MIVARAKKEGRTAEWYFEIFEIMFQILYYYSEVGRSSCTLQDEVVPNWMTKDESLQGLAHLAHAGPMFNFSAYLGAAHQGVKGGRWCYSGVAYDASDGSNQD
ncbi:hypothetical protein ACHAW5_008973 [Stephanodiscus triporus]|uniref:Uncharacterized protein n=1 Tax=Stephanodiscus triporus TaxID=2934178 RepID=A0ABD3NC92_9STRA